MLCAYLTIRKKKRSGLFVWKESFVFVSAKKNVSSEFSFRWKIIIGSWSFKTNQTKIFHKSKGSATKKAEIDRLNLLNVFGQHTRVLFSPWVSSQFNSIHLQFENCKVTGRQDSFYKNIFLEICVVGGNNTETFIEIFNNNHIKLQQNQKQNAKNKYEIWRKRNKEKKEPINREQSTFTASPPLFSLFPPSFPLFSM